MSHEIRMTMSLDLVPYNSNEILGPSILLNLFVNNKMKLIKQSKIPTL